MFRRLMAAGWKPSCSLTAHPPTGCCVRVHVKELIEASTILDDEVLEVLDFWSSVVDRRKGLFFSLPRFNNPV